MRRPQPRLFSSEDGRRSLKVVPVGGEANKWTTNATLFDLNADGSERKIAEWSLVNLPTRVLIPTDSDDFVVSWGSWMNFRSDPLIAIYDQSGRLLHELKLNDLLTPTDLHQMRIKTSVIISTSVNEWEEGAKFSFAVPETRTATSQATGTTTDIQSHAEKTRLNIAFKWGKKISIELATGKVENAD